MMFSFHRFVVAASVLLASTAIPTVQAGGNRCTPILDLVCARGSQFSTLCDLIKEYNLAPTLAGVTPVTVFAPTNKAFYKSSGILSRLSDDEIVDTLLTHVIPKDKIRSYEFECSEKYYMASGEMTQHICKKNGGRIQKGQGNAEYSPNLEAVNIDVCEGIVHVVDDVIFPAFDEKTYPEPCAYPDHPGCYKPEPVKQDKTIGAIACSTSGLETLCNLIKSSPTVKSLLYDPYQSLTVFAPKNSAFAKIESTLDNLGTAGVTFILKYHTVDEVLMSNDLSCSPHPNSFVQMANGLFTQTQCTKSKGQVFQFGTANTASNAPLIVDADIDASNGVIHIVNNVLLPEAEASKPEKPIEYEPEYCSPHYSYRPGHPCHPTPEHPIEPAVPEYPYDCPSGYYYPPGHPCRSMEPEYSPEYEYQCLPGYYYPRGHPCYETPQCPSGYYYPYGHPCYDPTYEPPSYDPDNYYPCPPGYQCPPTMCYAGRPCPYYPTQGHHGGHYGRKPGHV